MLASEVVNPEMLYYPSEGNEMQLSTPSEAGSIDDGHADKIWWHFIPVRTVMIPIVVKKIKKDEMSPRGGYFDREFLKVLNNQEYLVTPRWIQFVVDILMSAVTPSSDEEPPSVLLMLDGCIW